MCFSASASFCASGVLGVLGMISLLSAKKMRFVPLALIPLFFAVQQAAEGFVWMYESTVAARIFLFFALMIWPTSIPLALYCLEPRKSIARVLSFFIYAGLFLSWYLGASILYHTPEFSAQGCHIVYTFYPLGPLSYMLLAFWYCVVTILPFFISSYRYMELFGMLIALSCSISYLFFTLYFTSVWCFFSALISSIIAVILYNEEN